MRLASSQKYTPLSISDSQGEGFIATATPVGTVSAVANSFLEVVAPATLPEGYIFEAEVDGKTITVTVPKGGVEEGEKFSIPLDPESDAYLGTSVPHSSIPVGHWKVSVHNYCDLLSFVKVLLGQVMHRLKLTWLANEGGSAAQTESTFRILFWIGIVSWIVSNSLPYAPSSFIEEKDQATDAFYMGHFIVNIALLVVAAFRISLICKTREHIRNKYKIPSQQCHGCEDLCCAFWCSCCTVAQMARHTGDYATYQGMCCSETGLPPHAPSIV
ncbi:hypothetical protein HJC23_004452 [Cyclotella cryptica]|uniref:Uncharacterized protein n=1 Tax=Cyclotella cryptica TaxID=29204 RepID=A0ABD3QFZ8_9STRA